ncbi:MAG TPA: AAA family ATPase [Solirubrobacteraceae bacterium]|nr:AAA family ATPase [Solirubrobacteraceae bacterium]
MADGKVTSIEAARARLDREAAEAQAPPDDGVPPIGEPLVTRRDADDLASRVELVSFTSEQILGPIAPEKYLLPGIPAEAYTLIAGSLASYKTTLLIYLIVWKATGWDLLELDERGAGIDPGKCVLASYEDTDARLFAKLQRVVQHGYQLIAERWNKQDAAEFARRAAANIRRVPCSGRIDRGLVCRTESGLILPNTRFLSPFIEAAREFAPEGPLLGLDPLRLAIAGSQNDDDGADIVVHTLNGLATEIPGSGLIVCSHGTKAGAQEPAEGFAGAAYATSGSALFSQHARSNFALARLRAADALNTFARSDVSKEEADRQRVVRVTHGRLSHGDERADVYLVMGQGALRRVKPAAKIRGTPQVLAEDGPILLAAVQRIGQAGVNVSGAALEADEQLGAQLGRPAIRSVLKLLVQNSYLEKSGSTSDLSHTLTDKGRALLIAAHESGESRREPPKGEAA